MLSLGGRWESRGVRWLGIVPAIVVLFLMPVEYRAGATQPHPHAIFQLVWEASHGTPKHHHVRVSTHPCVRATWADDHATESHSGSETASPAHGAMAESDVASSADGTRASSTLLAVAFMPWLACLIWLATAAARQPLPAGLVPRGLSLAPELPPPQITP